MADENAATYKGWMELVQIRSLDKSDSCTLMFPLNENKTYLISSLSQSDFVLPMKMDETKLFIHVENSGKVEIVNASSPSSFEGIQLSNNTVLYPSDKAQLLDKMTFSVGPMVYLLRSIQSPGVAQLKTLLGNLQCGICLRFLENAQSLPCRHAFCHQCLVTLTKTTNLRSRNFPQRAISSLDSGNIPNEPFQVICPVCRQYLSSKEAASCRPEKVLTGVSKLFQSIVDGRPICRTCSNRRWLMHGSDYCYCETCDQVNCPLCTLNFHRTHKLRNNFATTLEKSRAFSGKTNAVKQRFAELMKTVDKNRSGIRRVSNWLDLTKQDLEDTSKLLGDCFGPLTNAHGKIVSFEEPNNYDLSEAVQKNALESFEKQLSEFSRVVSEHSKLLNAKLNVLEIAKKHWNPVINE